MNIKNLIVSIIGVGLLAGCTHKQVKVHTLHDNKLSCNEIVLEYAKTEMVLDDIDDKTGFSGRNVGMGLFFWPGIIVNQMNAGDAREAAKARIEVLSKLSNEKECMIDKEKLDEEKNKLRAELKDEKETKN